MLWGARRRLFPSFPLVLCRQFDLAYCRPDCPIGSEDRHENDFVIASLQTNAPFPRSRRAFTRLTDEEFANHVLMAETGNTHVHPVAQDERHVRPAARALQR